VIQDELNVKTITTVDNLDGIVQYAYKPNLKTLGPKYGKLLGMLRKDLPNLAPEILAPLRSGSNVSIEMGGETIELEPDDVLVSTEQSSEWGTADDSGVQVAISTKLSPELIEEGMARDFV
ncbi:MAG TPA: isoleucine--tRNA ligase, partial [Planctomycetaceae bacterium]|nr:isoleucine--tRNA ligase [Planctomycetaceae bacterium]